MADEVSKAAFIYEHLDALMLLAREKDIDDHAKRGILRFFFILLDDLAKLAGTLKNDLHRQNQINHLDADRAKKAIRVLKQSYDRQYDIIRDRFCAHGQPVDLAGVVGWWNEIDLTTLNVFHEDADGIKRPLAAAVPFRQITDNAPLDLKNARRLRKLSDVRASSDRLAMTRENTVAIICGHETQKKAQIIVSLIDMLEIDFDLTSVVNEPNTRFKTILFNIGWYLVVCDTCSLIDNLYEDTAYDASLLTIWRKHGIEARQSVEAAGQQRDRAFETNLRQVRNKLAAHLDSQMNLSDILRLFAGLDLRKLHSYAHLHVQTFYEACKSDVTLRPFLILNRPIKGIDSISRTGHEPFDE